MTNNDCQYLLYFKHTSVVIYLLNIILLPNNFAASQEPESSTSVATYLFRMILLPIFIPRHPRDLSRARRSLFTYLVNSNSSHSLSRSILGICMTVRKNGKWDGCWENSRAKLPLVGTIAFWRSAVRLRQEHFILHIYTDFSLSFSRLRLWSTLSLKHSLTHTHRRPYIHARTSDTRFLLRNGYECKSSHKLEKNIVHYHVKCVWLTERFSRNGTAACSSRSNHPLTSNPELALIYYVFLFRFL